MSMLGRMFGFGRNEHYDAGIGFFDAKRYEDAIQELTLAADTNPDELTDRLALFYIAESWAKLGMAALEARDYGRARESLGSALALNPHYADLHLHAGRAAHGLGDDLSALASYEQALAVNPRYAKAHFYRGLALYDLGRPDDALASIRAAVALDPGYQSPALDQALAAHEGGSHVLAHAALERIAETDVDDITFHARLGSDLYRRGLYAEASEEFRKALALNPAYADIRNHLGIALNAQGLHAEAVTEFREALAVNPHYTEARTNLGLTLRAAGRADEAAAEFARVLEDDPGNALARGGAVA